MSSHEVTFTNSDDSKETITVTCEAGSPSTPFTLDIGGSKTDSYTPDNKGILKFRIEPVVTTEKTRFFTYAFSTKHPFQFSKQKKIKKWELTLDVDTQNENAQISANNPPPTNVEVGVDEPSP